MAKGDGSGLARTFYHEWLDDDKLVLLTGWAREGYTDSMIAERMGIHNVTLSRWRQEHPKINEALKEGREVADYKVENALFKRALGYRVTEIKTVFSGMPDEKGSNIQRIEKLEKEVLPDTTAIAIWLNNRKPDQWKRNRDNFASLSDDEGKITVNIIKNGEKQKLEKVKEEEKDDQWDEWAEVMAEEEDWDDV